MRATPTGATLAMLVALWVAAGVLAPTPFGWAAATRPRLDGKPR